MQTLFRITLVVALVLGTVVLGPARYAAAQESKVKTLLLVGGSIHDWKGVGDIVEATLKDSGKFDVTRVSEDLNALLPERIEPYQLVVFYWTLGELTAEQKKGILEHTAQGNGFVTFHSGADSFRGDADWHSFVGGHFVTHPAYRQYQVSVTTVDHPITKGIDEYMTTDEQYILDYDKDHLTILANGLYKGDLMPALWVKSHGQGRVFYNSGGHDSKAVDQSMFKKLLVRGSLWAAGREVTD
jgi:type 1 glutamine amidotransferase